MDTETIIVGIGGLPRSGKDTLAELFIAERYFGVSLGDIVRNVSKTRHQHDPDPISVTNMTETSNWLRSEYGPDFALKKALNLFYEAQTAGGDHQGLVVWSIRAPIEVDFILHHHGQIIWVEADDAVRHQRAMANLRQGEGQLSLEAFKAQEALQWRPQPNTPPEIQMNVSYVKQKATKTIINNKSDLEDFNKRALELIKSLDPSYEQPVQDPNYGLY